MILQTMHQSKKLMSLLVSDVPRQLRMSSVFCLYPNGFKPLQHKSLVLSQSTRQRSTQATESERQSVFLPGNIVRSPMQDIEFPEVSFHEFLFSRLEEFKKYPAMTEFLTGKRYTYADLMTNAVKISSALHRLGYRKGDNFLVVSTNQNDFSLVMIAASCLGITFSAANPTSTADDLARQIAGCETKAIFTLPELAQTIRDAISKKGVSHQPKHVFAFGEADGLWPFGQLLEDDGKAFPDVPINPQEDVFVVPYSSGTTGLPKGVMLTHYNVVANLLQMEKTSSFSPEDNIIGLLPLYHIYGMAVITLSLLIGGGQIHFLPRFEPESFLRCMQDCKINKAHLVPPIILFLARHPMVSNFDLSTLRTVLCSAAPLGTELSLEFKARFSQEIVINQGYGMTELSPGANLDVEGNVPSVGPLLCNTFGKIVHVHTKRSLGANREGELCIKGPQVMKGYLNNKKATEEMIDSGGWVHTGDLAYYDEKGLFYISGRLKELIKYKGEQVAPAELEALLLGHPAVQDVAVVGVPDGQAGELPRAFVVKKPESSVVEADLIKFVEENVSPVKRLRGGVGFVDEIPRSPSGKTLRRLLKA